MTKQDQIKQLADWLRKSRNTVVLTGAGMSTESGIPDFRSQSGWWNKVDPRTVATVEALQNHYQLFHDFYSFRINALENLYPHKGHYILAEWEKSGFIQCIATQNVDGFHQLAGNENVYELHGSIKTIRCDSCQKSAHVDEFLKMEMCHYCKGKLRPNVVLFGENLPQHHWDSSINAIRRADLVVVIGTSLEVYPVSQLPTMTLGKKVFINLDDTRNSKFDMIINGKAKETLEKINSIL